MKKINILILLILLGIIFLLYFILSYDKKLYFNLNGTNDIELNIGDKYNEPGYEAKFCSKYVKFLCKDVSEHVKITKREINDKKYFLNYVLSYKNKKKVLIREINYVDKESPVIDFINDSLSFCPTIDNLRGTYKALDNADGDITDKVNIEIKNDKIYFSVVDSSGNKKTVFKNIAYKDNEAPVINLIGGTSYLFLNQEYIEKGVSITDNCDINIQNKLKITDNIDNKVPGTYEVTYRTIDSFNNISTKVRKVIVYKDTGTTKKNGKVVYLTFDDGPASYTEEILKVLDKYNVKATFFVTNQFSNYQSLIKTAYEKGHTIAVHTYSHNYKKIYSSVESYLEDFDNINYVIYEQTGEYSKIFRFPGGSSNTISKFNKGIVSEIAKKTNELGYYYFDWNVDSMDTSETNPDEIFNNVKNGMIDNEYSVVLMHDIKKPNIESVDKIISQGLEKGYTFLPLDENSFVYQHKINN